MPPRRHGAIVVPLPNVDPAQETPLLETPAPEQQVPFPSISPVPSISEISDPSDESDLTPVPSDIEYADPPEPSEPRMAPDNAFFIKALERITARLDTPHSKVVKAKSPDVFDGSDPKKLDNFMFQCQLAFDANSSVYDTASNKVTYALSYLRGSALDYFQSKRRASGTGSPAWLKSWIVFSELLESKFGSPNAVAEAETELDNLRMLDNQKIIKYDLAFDRITARLDWGERALYHQYYKGLPDRIKDAMIHSRPDKLDLLIEVAHEYDYRHWERIFEKSPKSNRPADDPKDGSSRTGKKHKGSDKKTTPFTHASHSIASGSKPPGSFGNKGKTSDRKPPLADKLGNDGKLTKDERTRRFENNLCMFCGAPGHRAASCPKSTKPKVRAANVASGSQEPSVPKN